MDAASRAITENEQAKNDAIQRATAAEESATEARKKAEAEAERKSKAEREAFRMRVFTGITFGGIAVVVFLVITHTLPWSWLVAHKNTIPLQIGVSATLMCASLGLFVGAWRKWCWGVGGLTFFVTLLTLMGN